MTPFQWLMLALIAALFVLMLRRRFGDVSPAEAKRLVEGGALLLDVRTPGEFASGHLPSALNVPLGELGSKLENLAAKDRAIVVYCASGVRSASAAGALRSAGYATVKNLGAMSRW